MNDIIFNEQQAAAIEKVVAWHRGYKLREHGKQVFFLAGFAGSGKTSVAFEIATQCCGSIQRVEFIAPTGKAASRLRQKGCHHARTMHQFIYNLRGEDPETGEPIFGPKSTIDGKPDLIICDESSMLGEYDYNTLIGHGIPVLALGDIGQLPPVKAVAAFTADHVDVLLDKIERQGGQSNIIRASMFVRQGKCLPYREYDDVRVRPGSAPLEELLAHVGEDGQILCSYNKTREDVNRAVRRALTFTDPLPMPGEKVVCKFNQHGFGIMNGEQGIVLRYEQVDARKETRDDLRPDEEDDGMRIWLKSLTDGREIRVKFKKDAFDPNWEVRREAMKKPGAFDFGYAMTVHSAQGSEWPNVLVIEESMRGVPYHQLMYTAITRAQSQLTIYR
jgi:exodeoxyribonuclease V